MKIVLLCLGCFLLGVTVPIGLVTWACLHKIKGKLWL